MLNTDLKKQINTARDILVGRVPNPLSQIEMITNALIYKFMDDQDRTAQTLPGGKASFFIKNFEKYAWHKLFDSKLSNQDRANLYIEGIEELSKSKHLPELFKDIFKDAFLPFRDANTIAMFLNEINKFDYSHSEDLGNAFEYLLSIMGSQGDAGQFRTPRNIIEFIVDAVNPTKDEHILDPACGTAGFLVEAYKHITTDKNLSPNEVQELAKNIHGVDIDPGMAKIARVNLYLHGFKTPLITEDDTLTNESLWGKKYDVILANPPFMTPKGGIKPHDKFSVQSSRAEVLFTDYIAEHLKLSGRAGIVVPEGVVSTASKAYKQLRKMLIEDDYLWGVVSLPAGVFNPYSSVKTTIFLLDRSRAKENTEIMFYNIEHDGFGLGAKRQESKKNDIPEALEVVREWRSGKKLELEKASYVEKKRIAEDGDYDLDWGKYIDPVDYSKVKWPVVDLGSICNLIRGVTYSKKDEVDSGGLEVLRANNIKLNSTLNFEDIKIISPDLNLNTNKKLCKNDIFICLASGSKTHVGKVAYIEEDTDYYFGGFMGVVRIKNNNEVVSRYIFEQLKNQKFNDFLRRSINGVNINNLSSKILSRYKIPLPPLEIQQQLIEEIDAENNSIKMAKSKILSHEKSIDNAVNKIWGE